MIDEIMIDRIEKLRNIHEGERCVLIANGPSLNQMDLTFLENEVCIGLNKIYLGIEKFNFYPRYYVAVNEKVICQSINQIKNLNCIKFLAKKNEYLISANELTYFLETRSPPLLFCNDISCGINEGYSVTYAALQIIFYLGFKEVIIIGLDHKYSYNGGENESQIYLGPDKNHFSEEYFGYGLEWDTPDLKNSEKMFRIARSIYENNGRLILDATECGKCNVFEKVNYKEFFNINKK